jgi:hypothetical protein
MRGPCKRFDIPVARSSGTGLREQVLPRDAIDMGRSARAWPEQRAEARAATTNAWRFKCWVQDGEVKGEGIATTWWDSTTRTGIHR